MKYIDLHTHSNISDGTDTPEQLVENAKKAQLAAIALTDHDTVKGVTKAAKKAKELDIEFIYGVELSSKHTIDEIHILGYWFESNPEENTSLQKAFSLLQEYRQERNEELFKKLAKIGMPITEEEVRETVGQKEREGQLICRPNIALTLVKKGFISDLKTAFLEYLGVNGRAYVPKKIFSHREVIDLLRSSNALVGIAHPFLTKCKDEIERKNLIKELKDMGLQAIESYYSLNTQEETALSVKYAKEFDLLCTGGSDYHGHIKPHIQLGVGKGGLRVNYDLLEKMKEYVANC